MNFDEYSKLHEDITGERVETMPKDLDAAIAKLTHQLELRNQLMNQEIEATDRCLDGREKEFQRFIIGGWIVLLYVILSVTF